MTITRSLLSGLSRKSMAPDRIASTAVAVLPCPEIITTGSPSSMRPQLPQHLHAVHAWHLDVEQHDVRPFAANDVECFLSAGGADELIVLVLEDHPQRIADRRLVIDDKDAGFHSGGMN